MKKYLMMGAAALLVGGATFTSCSSDKELYDASMDAQRNAEQFLQDYAANFKKVFGEIAPEQTWGFGATAGARATRANAGDNYPATHEYTDANGNVVAGANMNHNEWADPNKEFGGWVVPDPLTNEQKAIVAAYFQSVKDIKYQDPEWRHFFVQQVYKGGNAKVYETTEGIIAANGSAYTSDNMNLLTVGEANSHINDFNAGTCSQSNVLDNGQHVNGGTTHTDQITLMVNVDDTSCFGYHETGSSTHHNNKAALVSWETIRDWANAKGMNGNCLEDGWNRSFMGFDLAIKEGEQAYATDENGNVQYADYSQAAESPKYAWDGEKIIEIADPTKYYPVEYYDEYKTIMNVGWLTTNENFYKAADKVTMSQTISMNRVQASTITTIQNAPVLKDIMDGDNYYQSVINLPRIKQLVDAGYLPVNNKNLAEWVQVGVSDGYFSDWIVTLTKANRITIPTPPTDPFLRVICEDISATEAGDFDFNDVVFDVKFISTSEVEVTIDAAGGTLPLEVDGREVHNLFIAANQGAKTDQNGEINQQTMINTNAKRINPQAPYSSAELANRPSFRITNKTWTKNQATFAQEVKEQIVVRVFKKKDNEGEAQWVILDAPQGKAPGKVGVPALYKWADEKVNIGNNFKNYVADPNYLWWEDEAYAE